MLAQYFPHLFVIQCRVGTDVELYRVRDDGISFAFSVAIPGVFIIGCVSHRPIIGDFARDRLTTATVSEHTHGPGWGQLTN